MNFNVGGINVTVFGELSGTKNAVFLLHGRLQAAESLFEFAAKVARGNLVAIVFEQRNHGSRLVNALANQGWKENPNHGQDMWAIQFGTASDVSFLITTLPLYLPCFIQSWGVAGVSLGGHATLLALAHEDRLQVGVCIIGCGDYQSLMFARAFKAGLSIPPESFDTLNEALLVTLSLHDPIHRVNHFRDKALLMLSGEKDTLVPASSNDAFVASLKSHVYHESPLFQVVMEPGAKHEFTPFMQSKTLEWLQTHLGDLKV